MSLPCLLRLALIALLLVPACAVEPDDSEPETSDTATDDGSSSDNPADDEPADDDPADDEPADDEPADDEPAEPDCDEAALEELASKPRAIRTTWLGFLEQGFEACPEAGMGWTTEQFLSNTCIYGWVGEGEPLLCELPFLGEKGPWEWLQTDFDDVGGA